MAIQEVRAHLHKWNKASDVIELEVSTATVDLAATAIGVAPARIAKSITFTPKTKNGEQARGTEEQTKAIIIVCAGDSRVDNKRFRDQFGIKSKMLTPEEVFEATGHTVGGVSPFGMEDKPVALFLDDSVKRFTTVFPACGSANSLIELGIDELYAISGAKGWVNVCKDWEGQTPYEGGGE